MSKEEKKESTKKVQSKKTNTNNKNKPKATKKIDNKESLKKDEKVVKTTKETKVVEKIEEKKNTTDKIKKIEEKSKKEKKMPKSSRSKKDSFIKFATTLDEKRKIIYGFIGGLLLGLLIMVIFMPDRIATLKDGTQPVASVDGEKITANKLYEDMKDHFSVSVLLDEIDNKILTELYEENDEMMENVNSNAEYYLNMYKQYYGYDEATFLEKNGFASYEQFLDFLKLDYRRAEYEKDYLEKNIKDNEIQKYYDENVYGDINCEHVLVSVSSEEDGLSDEDAKKLAEEIINKLNDGTSWDDIKKEYKDKVTYENLGYQAWDASLETSFLDAIKEMDENTYSEEPVKTSYGYHVIHKLDQKDTPKLKEEKDTIVEKLIEKAKKDDENSRYKALINLREEHKLEFTDTDLKEKYEAYCKEYK